MFSSLPLVGRLVSRRKSFALSLAKLAERCGIAETSLRQWEAGGGLPPTEMLCRWATALDLQLALVPLTLKPRHRIAIDWRTRRITADDSAVRLAPTEWAVLERLARTPGYPVSQRQLSEHLYGEYRPDSPRAATVRVIIGRLRRKLPLAIDSQPGQGYLVTGIDPTPADLPPEPPRPPSRANSAGQAAVEHPRPATPRRLPGSPPPRPAPFGRSERPARAAAMPLRPVSEDRSEELGAIEQFLAENGPTRCPDTATMAQASLPSLVWDGAKRKWVRPSPDPGGKSNNVSDEPRVTSPSTVPS